MEDPLVLYSTNTWLAYKIAQAYYAEEHYVWCTPYFSSGSLPSWDYAVPPSSSPSEIYIALHEDASRGDLHSGRIEANKAGILRGANCKEKDGVITKKQKAEIYAIVNRAETRDFKPLMYIIPFVHAAKLMNEVPVHERSHPLSAEYTIRHLPRKCFDVIEFNRS